MVILLVIGMWSIPDGKVGEWIAFMCWSFKGGSTRLSRLRTDHLAPVIKFDYGLAYTRFMGYRKISSFVGRQDRSYHTISLGCISG
jgi:hypothetical protein